MKLKKKYNKKSSKTKEITIKKIGIKFDIKVIWNQMLRDEIEKKNSIRKRIKNKQIKKIRTKFDIKLIWN